MWLRAALAGADGPGRRALPAGELLHPVPLVALILLVANDWLAKPSPAVPGWLSGKLSDVAGLVAAPLVATAAVDCALLLAARAGARVDFSLGRGRLTAAVFTSGLAFAAVKLWPAAARAFERAGGLVGLDWRAVADPTDLVALPALAVAWWVGRREIARVPLGRIEVLERRWRASGQDPRSGLNDVIACGAPAELAEELARALQSYFEGGSAAPARAALGWLRGSPGGESSHSRNLPP